MPQLWAHLKFLQMKSSQSRCIKCPDADSGFWHLKQVLICISIYISINISIYINNHRDCSNLPKERRVQLEWSLIHTFRSQETGLEIKDLKPFISNLTMKVHVMQNLLYQ